MLLGRRMCRFAVVLGMAAIAPMAAAQKPSDVVSEVNGVKITLEDLEKSKANKLLQARYQFYLAQQKALDELIEERLLEPRPQDDAAHGVQRSPRRTYLPERPPLFRTRRTSPRIISRSTALHMS